MSLIKCENGWKWKDNISCFESKEDALRDARINESKKHSSGEISFLEFTVANLSIEMVAAEENIIL